MAMIQPKDVERLKTAFEARLVNPVRLIMVTQETECQFCRETRQIAEELAAISDKITTTVYDLVADKAAIEPYGIDKIPAIAVLGAKDYGIRFFGIPSGYEFSSLIEIVVAVSRGESAVSKATRDALASLSEDLHIQVFATPTCPYCPRAVMLAMNLALASDRVRADAVEAMEFPHLAIKYGVQGVPRTVVNESIHIEGAVPEAQFVAEVWKHLETAST